MRNCVSPLSGRNLSASAGGSLVTFWPPRESLAPHCTRRRNKVNWSEGPREGPLGSSERNRP